MTDRASFRRAAGPRAAGMEIFEVTPVLLGGHPTDPANKTLLTRRQHIEAVRYWNRLIAELLARRAQ
jgi:hypothetical protein